MKETNWKQERPAREKLLVRQQPWKFGPWNCKTLEGIERNEMDQLMLEERFDVLELCETRMNSDGLSDLSRNYTILCSNDPERKGRNEIALIFNYLKM